jgi:hypothetical protein
MSTLQPPRVATWLLEHLQSSPNNESLAGDLFEEYRQGRSRVWYWKEVLAAIIVRLCRELIAHPVLALRAIAIAWAVRFLYLYIAAWTVFTSIDLLSAWVWHVQPPTPSFGVLWFRAVVLWFRMVVPPVGPMVTVWWTLDLSICAVTGWTVARFHQTHRTAMVMVAAISVFFYQLQVLPWVWFHARNTLTNTRFLPYLVTDFVALIGPPLCIVLGGLWGASRERDARDQRDASSELMK